jgi:hypothetical protein
VHYCQVIVFKSNIIWPHSVYMFNLLAHLVYLLEDCTIEPSTVSQTIHLPVQATCIFQGRNAKYAMDMKAS